MFPKVHLQSSMTSSLRLGFTANKPTQKSKGIEENLKDQRFTFDALICMYWSHIYVDHYKIYIIFILYAVKHIYGKIHKLGHGVISLSHTTGDITCGYRH